MLKNTIPLSMMFLAALGASSAQEEKLKELKGAIIALDGKTGTLTLHQLMTDKQHTFSLAAMDLQVTDPLGRKLKLDDLREELRVTAMLRNEAEVVGLRVDGPYQNGMIKTIDKVSQSVTLKGVFGETTYRIPESAKVIVGGKDGSLKQLKAGDAMQVLFALDKKTILQVQIGKGVHSRDPYLRVVRFYGILTELDHAKRRVQVFVQSTDAGVIKTYEVSPDAQLRTMYHLKPVSDVGFEQFSKWVKVYYFVDRDTGKIVNMDADLPIMVRRKVVKFDGGTRKLTVEDELKEKTFDLAADVKVMQPKGDGKLADIAANRIVNCGLSLDRSRVQVVYLWDK